LKLKAVREYHSRKKRSSLMGFWRKKRRIAPKEKLETSSRLLDSLRI